MDNTYWRFANRAGLFLALLFVLCFAWYFIRPVEQELHLSLLKMAYFGFNAMDVTGFIAGVIQTYIWGYIAVALWYLVRNV